MNRNFDPSLSVQIDDVISIKLIFQLKGVLTYRWYKIVFIWKWFKCNISWTRCPNSIKFSPDEPKFRCAHTGTICVYKIERASYEILILTQIFSIFQIFKNNCTHNHTICISLCRRQCAEHFDICGLIFIFYIFVVLVQITKHSWKNHSAIVAL
jgi:hypothetical protein